MPSSYSSCTRRAASALIGRAARAFDWTSADHPPEDSFYAWGPKVPEEFVTNHEIPG